MLYILVLFGGIILDQLSKWHVATNFQLYESIPIVDGILYLTYIKNAGAAFGILQNHRWLFLCSTLIIIAVVSYYFFTLPKEGHRLLKLSLVFVITGGLGNQIDRIRLGYVVDFLDTRIWPVFNVADSLVTIGSILLAYIIIFKHKEVEM